MIDEYESKVLINELERRGILEVVGVDVAVSKVRMMTSRDPAMFSESVREDAARSIAKLIAANPRYYAASASEHETEFVFHFDIVLGRRQHEG